MHVCGCTFVYVGVCVCVCVTVHIVHVTVHVCRCTYGLCELEGIGVRGDLVELVLQCLHVSFPFLICEVGHNVAISLIRKVLVTDQPFQIFLEMFILM